MQRLLRLAEVEPEAILPQLCSLIESATPEQIAGLNRQPSQRRTGGGTWPVRRELVWLSEWMLQFPQFFPFAERILFQLALRTTPATPHPSLARLGCWRPPRASGTRRTDTPGSHGGALCKPLRHGLAGRHPAGRDRRPPAHARGLWRSDGGGGRRAGGTLPLPRKPGPRRSRRTLAGRTRKRQVHPATGRWRRCASMVGCIPPCDATVFAETVGLRPIGILDLMR
jgi:hypothetical protein